jgi:aspartate/methionine/tyrosine aminotransferase
MQLAGYLGNMYSELLGRSINGLDECVVYSGAQHGIACALTAFCEPGDEICVVEPCFDAYMKLASVQGIKCVGVPLRPKISNPKYAGDFVIDAKELSDAISERTKLLILNTPQTFLGKTYDRNELEEIADVVRSKHDNLVVLSDEVYEFMTFQKIEHERFATIQDMYDRTISLFSAGKTFSTTGWRVGYSVAPPHLSKPLADATALTTFCAPHPFQRAVHESFVHVEKSYPNYYEDVSNELEAKSTRLMDALSTYSLTYYSPTSLLTSPRKHTGQTSLRPIKPMGGYFLMANCSAIRGNEPFSVPEPQSDIATEQYDWKLCEWLTREVGVVAIPASSAYTESTREQWSDEDVYVRFAFCKADVDIDNAVTRLLEGANRFDALSP